MALYELRTYTMLVAHFAESLPAQYLEGRHSQTKATVQQRFQPLTAAVKKHANYTDSGYLVAVETAFQNWEALQNAGR
jgi:hypothetical protein